MSKMNRRELLVTSVGAIAGGAGLILLNACRDGSSSLNAGSDTGPCPLNPEQEEGPFYVDEGLLRSDVLDGQTGVPLLLSIKVMRAVKCERLRTRQLKSGRRIVSANILIRRRKVRLGKGISGEFRSVTPPVSLSSRRSIRAGTRSELATSISRSARVAQPRELLTPLAGAPKPLAGRSSFLLR
jgi:hypothetical protein